MKKLWSNLLSFSKDFWIGKVLPIWRPFSSLMVRIIGVLLICLLFKFVFFTNCLEVNNAKLCASDIGNETNTLFTIGGLLLAIFIMIPTFWIESKIRDAKKEVIEELQTNIRNDMQKINEAQILLLEVNKFYTVPNSFSDIEKLVKRAVEIWPDFKQKEFLKLGINMSKAVVHGYFPIDQGIMGLNANGLRKDEIAWLNRDAISFLKETALHSNILDKEGLVYLACMYGYQKEFFEMMKNIDFAIKVSEEVKEEFKEPLNLLSLIRACSSDRNKLERLGRKIGLNMPTTKEVFCTSLRDTDIIGRKNSYIPWIVVRRSQTSSDENIFIVKIYAQDITKERRVNAFYYKRDNTSKTEEIADSNNPISIDELFERINSLFFIICQADELD